MTERDAAEGIGGQEIRPDAGPKAAVDPVSGAVGDQIVMLAELGRTDIGLPELKASLQETPSLRLLPLDFAQLDVLASLRNIRDPFDRVIASAALATGSRLITKDVRLSESAWSK